MIDASTEHMVDSTRPSQTSWKPSDLLANYERLLGLYTDQLQENEFNPYQSIPLLFLKSFSPAFQMRIWKDAAPFFKIPNTLRQDLAGGALILQELEGLDDQTLRGCRRVQPHKPSSPNSPKRVRVAAEAYRRFCFPARATQGH